MIDRNDSKKQSGKKNAHFKVYLIDCATTKTPHYIISASIAFEAVYRNTRRKIIKN